LVRASPKPDLALLESPDWQDYELLDSGGGSKLERYGRYVFVRPEHQAIWKPVYRLMIGSRQTRSFNPPERKAAVIGNSITDG